MDQSDNYTESKNFSHSSFNDDFSAELSRTVEHIARDRSAWMNSPAASDSLKLPGVSVCEAADSAKEQDDKGSDHGNPQQDSIQQQREQIQRAIEQNRQEIARIQQALVSVGLERIAVLIELGDLVQSRNPVYWLNNLFRDNPVAEWERDLVDQANSIRDHLTDQQLQPVVDYFRRHGRMIPGTRQLTGHIPPSSPDLNLQRAIDLENYMRGRR
jgi:hypothetical protein